MQDDALNCHGTHLRIIGKPAENQLMMRFMHKQTYGFAAYQAGDEIAVISKDNLREYDGNPRRKVTAIERVNDKEWLLTLNGPAPEFKKDDVVDNITWYPDLTATNNHVSMDPVRGFLITTRGKVLVENNTFHRPAMAGILIENDASGWFESGPIRDMVIRNNRFVRCGISINPHTRSDKPEEPVHENIRIENNEFSEGGRITARNVRGLAILHKPSPEGPGAGEDHRLRGSDRKEPRRNSMSRHLPAAAPPLRSRARTSRFSNDRLCHSHDVRTAWVKARQPNSGKFQICVTGQLNNFRSSERNWMASNTSLGRISIEPARSARVRATFRIRSWARAEKFISSIACSR